MRKVTAKTFFLFLFLLLFFTIEGLFTNSVKGSETEQTVPTRTPTPPPPAATQPSGGGPQATDTPPPVSPTATSVPITFAPTPAGGFIPTAVPCSDSPTIQTRGATNVRGGPGINYPVIGELVYLEVRTIIGRAAEAEWWLIQFNDDQAGWVADEVVIVAGYSPIVPIVEAPSLAGSTATPGPSWNPTPNPSCTVTPRPTETPSPAPLTETEQVSPTATASDTPSPSPPPPTEILPTDTPIVLPTDIPLTPTEPSATAVPSTAEESGGNGAIFVIAAVLLIGLGLIVFFLRRR